MKHFFLGTAFLVAGSFGPIAALQAAEHGCEPPNAAMIRADMGSQSAGSTAIRLDGDRAERFFDYLNDKVGRNTDYWGDGVIIGRYPALGYDSVAIVDDGCVDETKMIRLDPRTTMLALEAAENPSD
jgi:hypothetical protein